MIRRRVLFSTVATAALLCGSAWALPLSGTFDLGGTIRVTTTNMDWIGNQIPTLAERFALTGGTGSFAVIPDGTQETIRNLSILIQPVGVQFASTPFIVFNTVPSMPTFLLNFIQSGNGGSAGCLEGAIGRTPGQTCTPPNGPFGSPFTFANNCSGTTAQCLAGTGTVTSSTGSWDFYGVTSDGLSKWHAVFTAQFVGQSYQDVLTAYARDGFIQKSYSGNASVSVTPIPEPGSMALFGIGFGLVLFPFVAKRSRWLVNRSS